MIRWFICTGISTVASLVVCAFILPLEAVVFPLCLTSLMYIGSFILKILSIWSSWAEHGDRQIDISFHGIKSGLQNLINWMVSAAYNISVWRMYMVAPLTEELCMISLLLCGGSNIYTHLNHLLELYMQQNSSLLKASMVVGFQLGYTVTLIFGSYASFLFVRTAVSALVKDVIGRLTSQLIKEFGLIRRFKGDILRLKEDFEQIQAVLEDAEEKHIKEKAVELWLQRLRSASLKVENVLDEVSTEALLQRLNKEIDVERGIKIGIKYKDQIWMM